MIELFRCFLSERFDEEVWLVKREAARLTSSPGYRARPAIALAAMASNTFWSTSASFLI